MALGGLDREIFLFCPILGGLFEMRSFHLIRVIIGVIGYLFLWLGRIVERYLFLVGARSEFLELLLLKDMEGKE